MLILLLFLGTVSYDDNHKIEPHNSDNTEKESDTIDNATKPKNVRELLLLDCSSDESDLEDCNKR